MTGSKQARVLLDVVLPAGLLAVAVVPWLVAWSRLPSSVAVHWGLSGSPNGHSSRVFAACLTIGLTAAACIVMIRPHDRADRAAGRSNAVAIAAFIAGLFAAISLSTVAVNYAGASWRDAHLAPWWIAVVLVAGASAAGVAVRLHERGWPDRAAPPAPPGGAVTLGPSERLAWTGRCSSWWAAPAAAVLVVAGAVGLRFALLPAITPLVVAVVLVEFRTVRVVAGVNGVAIRAALGWPRMRIPLERITGAEAIDVNPTEWGGWGYRGSLRVMHRAAWVLRRGPGIELHLKDGGKFVVTVDNADAGAAAVNGLLPRAS